MTLSVLQITLFIALALLALVLLSYWLAPNFWARRIIDLRRRRGHLQEHEIEHQGIRWHYLDSGEVAGDEEPPLLALHGFGADADHWVDINQHLGESPRLIAPDLPGFGDTPLPDGYSFQVARQARRVLEFADALGLERFHLAGNSMGAYIASHIAETAPERVVSLWLMAPFGVQGGQDSPTMTAIRSGDSDPFHISNHREFEQRVLEPMFHRKPWLPYPLRYFMAERALDRLDMGRSGFEEIVTHGEPLESLARRVRVPVLLEWGDRDQVVDYSGQAILAERLPRVEVVTDHDVGHLPQLECPRRAVEHFRRFLDRIQDQDN